MSEVVVFQHDPFEDLGFFAEVLEKQHAAYRVVRLFHDEMPEENWEQVKALIILGGPMNVDDETSFPILRWEKRIIRAAIDEAVPVLGICLGAQLIATTLGAAVFHGAVKEIGWSPISITPHGQVDSLLGYLPENATVFQWHGDGFELPVGRDIAGFLAALSHPGISLGENYLRPAISSRGDTAHDRTMARRAHQRLGAVLPTCSRTKSWPIRKIMRRR